MRVAIVNVTSGGLSGGCRKYLRELVPRLQASPAIEELRQFFPAALADSDAGAAPTEIFPDGDARRMSPVLRAQLRDYRPSVVFVLTSRIVPGQRCPQVIMVRNMEPLEVPFEHHPMHERVRNVGRATSTYLSCQLATRVIAVSNHVRSFLERRWRLREDKIGVVYHGVDAPLTARRPRALDGVAERSFLLTIGSIRPARGLEDLIGALGELAKRGQRPRVVVAGGVDPGMDGHRAYLDRLARELGVVDQLTWTGRLTGEELAWCFRSSRAFVMTSRAEACPNTVLEALAYGCLSISTDHPPMPEFFGDAAIYYRARDASSLAARLATLDGLPPDDEARLRARAIERAGFYRWEDTARRTIVELTRALDASPPAGAALMRLFR